MNLSEKEQLIREDSGHMQMNFLSLGFWLVLIFQSNPQSHTECQRKIKEVHADGFQLVLTRARDFQCSPGAQAAAQRRPRELHGSSIAHPHPALSASLKMQRVTALVKILPSHSQVWWWSTVIGAISSTQWWGVCFGKLPMRGQTWTSPFEVLDFKTLPTSEHKYFRGVWLTQA